VAEIIQARDLRGPRTDRLKDAVPLDAPWTLFIEPTNACNFRCQYCPTGHPDLLAKIGRKNVLMDFDLFKKIVDDMKAFSRKVRMVNLYKDGESLLHPKFCEMVRYLRDADVTEQIWVKTNGYPLRPEMNDRLVDCGLDMIGISVQAVTSQGFYDIARVRVDYEKYRLNVLDLFQKSRGKVQVSAKIADVGLSETDKEKFYADFGDRTDFLAIEGLHGWSASDKADFRMGTDNSFDGTPRTVKVACPLVLYMLAVSANGDISICNDDWMHVHQIGRVSEQSLLDIWRGRRLLDFRMMHLEGRRSENAACGTCDYLQALPDNIDQDRNEFARRLR